jgi:hypothetical protein
MTLTNAIKSSGAEIVTNSDGYDHYILNLSPKKRHTGGNNDIIALVTGGAAKIAHENNKVLSIITGGSIKPKTQCDIRNLIMLGGAKPKRKIDYEKYKDRIKGKGNSMAELLMNNARYEAQFAE